MADTALAQYFGMSADFWMNLQSAYELDITQHSSAASGQGDKADSKAHRDAGASARVNVRMSVRVLPACDPTPQHVIPSASRGIRFFVWGKLQLAARFSAPARASAWCLHRLSPESGTSRRTRSSRSISACRPKCEKCPSAFPRVSPETIKGDGAARRRFF